MFAFFVQKKKGKILNVHNLKIKCNLACVKIRECTRPVVKNKKRLIGNVILLHVEAYTLCDYVFSYSILG